jgi:LacI family transcriptional regulator
VIGEAKFTQLTLRVRGICEFARKAGMSVELIGLGDWNTAQDGFEVGRMLASRAENERPDFVIGLTDMLAAGAIEGIGAAGLAVPDDMLVAGCDGNPLAWGGTVPLTTIKSPGYEIGCKGVQLLLAQLADKDSEPRQEYVAPQLIERMSTAVSSLDRKRASAQGLNLAEYL